MKQSDFPDLRHASKDALRPFIRDCLRASVRASLYYFYGHQPGSWSYAQKEDFQRSTNHMKEAIEFFKNKGAFNLSQVRIKTGRNRNPSIEVKCAGGGVNGNKSKITTFMFTILFFRHDCRWQVL